MASNIFQIMRYFVIFLVVSFTFASFFVSHADALCVRNQDWPEAPCYGCPGCRPTIEEEKQDWAPYYDYKGKEFMEQKKQEMLTAIKNDKLDEWLHTGPEDQHQNVHHYYELHGLETELMFSGLTDTVVSIIVAVGVATGIGIFVLKKL